MVRSEDLPPICVASKIRDIATRLKELNDKIIVRELHLPITGMFLLKRCVFFLFNL